MTDQSDTTRPVGRSTRRVSGAAAPGRTDAGTEMLDSLLRSAAESLGGVIFRRRLAPDGSSAIDFVAGDFGTLLGTDPQPFVEDPARLLDLIVPEDRPAAFAALKSSRHERAQTEVEFRVAMPGRGLRWIRLYAVPASDRSGAELWDVVLSDISVLRAAQDEADLAHRRLVDAIENVPEGFAIWDREDRLILSNSQMRGIYPAVPLASRVGVRFEDILRAGVAAGMHDTGDRGAEAYIRWRLACHRDPKGSIEQRLADGRWIRISERRTREGGTVGVWADVTEFKEREAALRESEARLSAVAESLPGTVFRRILRPDGTIHYPYISGGAETLYGVPAARIIEDPVFFMNMLHPEDRPRMHAAMRRSAETMGRCDYESRMTRANGEEAWIRSISEPERMEDGSIAWTGIVLDITEQKRAEAHATDLATRLGQILEDSPLEIYFIDAETQRFIEVNRGARGNTGYTIDELRCMTPRHLNPDYDGARTQRSLERQRGHQIAIETTNVRKDGSRYPVELILQRARFAGRPVILAIGQDITERKRAEAALREAMERAEVASRAKSDFLARMSHELRTPLNAVIGFSEMLETEVFGPLGDPRYRAYAADIRSSGTHLLSLISDILDLSKIEARKYELREAVFELRPLVADCLRVVAEDARGGGLRLTTRISRRLPRLHADPRALKQILINLLSNAVKYTRAGGRVTVSAREAADGGVALTVTDTGVGMTRDEIPRALAPFEQTESARTCPREGTGLGLPLVKSLAELHGGSVAIRSRPGQGTAVTVHLPPERLRRGEVG